MKRLVVCCDGTWNRPGQIKLGEVTREDGTTEAVRHPAPTNVPKLALGVAREDEEGNRQLVFYEPGVGTRRFERIRGGAFGLGLSRNVRSAYRFVVEHYEPGDELYLFGFSRGAFTARSTAGLIRNAGILRAEHADRISEAYRLYRARRASAHPARVESELFRRMYAHGESDIHLIGVWDTVGSLGIPIDGIRLPLITKLWSFHDTGLSSHVRHAYQALAIDEQRRPFKPTLWEQQPEAAGEQVLEQVWFAGVHSDVGGGYPDPALAEIPLLWMVERARRAGLAFVPSHFKPTGGAPDPQARALGQRVAPDALGRLHDSRTGIYRLLSRHLRPLAADGGAVASSAVRRLEQDAAYAPVSLEDYLSEGGRVEQLGAHPTA